METMMPYKKYIFICLFAVLVMQSGLPAWSQRVSFITSPVNRVAAGAVFRYTFSAIDSAGQAITYSCAGLPAWIRFDKKTNTITGVAKKPGQFLIHLRAATSDTVARQDFMLTVYNQQTVNILPLGNSITNGTSSYNSYRRSLWQLLHKAGYNFDLVGSWSLHHMGGPVPDPDFDMDHDGHSGWKASDILQPPDWDKQRGNIDAWLGSYTPDIVLMELGTNEVFQCTGAASAMADIASIIDKLRKKNAAVKILLAQIPPLGNQWAPKKLCGTDTAYEQAVLLFNKAIVEFAQTKTSARSPVIIVDQFTGIDPATDMYDDIHPNLNGEIKMAERWYNAVKPFLKKLK